MAEIAADGAMVGEVEVEVTASRAQRAAKNTADLGVAAGTVVEDLRGMVC